MIRRIGFFLAAVLLTAGAALAGPNMVSGSSREGTWDFSIKTLYGWDQSYTADNGSSISLDGDLGWGFGLGYNVSEQFKVGFAFGWRSLPYSLTIVSETDATDTRSYGNYLDTSTFSVSGDYVFGKNRLKPYVSGNLGWLSVNTNIVADVDVGCWYYPWLGYVCDTYTQTYGTDAFTYGLGLGAQFDITPTAFLKVGWDHQWNDLDAMNSNDLLRCEIGFRM